MYSTKYMRDKRSISVLCKIFQKINMKETQSEKLVEDMKRQAGDEK